ncbi:dihydropteroate synthase [Paucihalobacter sp.]|uniref:dihydropteroate synthase n=1 Tax=Paucihalobacter sp. TaxID=2850405 RepID=UPI002FE016C2
MNINCNGQLIDLTTPKIMGVLNLTPDSFYDGGKYKDTASILKTVATMLEQGATFIDVGGYSSKPGADFVSEFEELNRVIGVVKLLIEEFPNCLISIDTFRSKVAEAAVKQGAVMVNDISAGILDDNMIATISKLKVPYIMMHMRGTPQTMTQLTDYDHLIKDIIAYFGERLQLTKLQGIADIIIDPGFGFAKSIQQNFELLSQLELLQIVDKPILVGVSRKSMIYKTLQTSPEHALNGTTALNMIALEKGANILRVHDVKEAMECVTLYNQLHKQ